MSTAEILRIVIVGHVDHGKSTLIGRLFYDTNSLPPERLAEIEETCRRQGRPFEFAYLMDALEEERAQNVTIETTQTFFKTKRRTCVIIDAPGHKQFLKNMVTGAAAADAAILIVDGAEGVREQTRRHAYLLSLLGIRQVIVAVNKMDLVAFSRERFAAVEAEILRHLHLVGITPTWVVPISARGGEVIANRGASMPWYAGPTLLEALDSFEAGRGGEQAPLRFPVQDVYRQEGVRYYAGRVESGAVRAGDAVICVPSGAITRVRTVEKWASPPLIGATAGESVALTFTDELFIERGEVIAHPGEEPRALSEFRSRVFWLGRGPLLKGQTYRVCLATAEVDAQVVAITERLDSSTLTVIARHADRLENTEVGDVTFAASAPIAADLSLENPAFGRFVVFDQEMVSGGGTIIEATGALAEHRRVRAIDAIICQEPDPNFVDLTRELGALEFEASPALLARIRAGERILFRLAGLDHLVPLARFAFERGFAFEYRREGEGSRVLLYGTGGADPGTAPDADGGI